MGLQKVGISLTPCPDSTQIFSKHAAHESQAIPRRKLKANATHKALAVPWATEKHNCSGQGISAESVKALIQELAVELNS
jgi:hypothetical protein